MDDTATPTAIDQVRALQNEITATLENQSLTANQRLLLDQIADQLREIDTLLVWGELNDHIASLKEKSQNLKYLNEQSQTQLAGLSALANTISSVSNVIAKLAKTATRI